MILVNLFSNSQRLSNHAGMGLGNPVTLAGNTSLSFPFPFPFSTMFT